MKLPSIRGAHPASFRSGEWARIIGLEWRNGRLCYVVLFVDDVEDSWPVYDASNPYEFRESQSLREHDE